MRKLPLLSTQILRAGFSLILGLFFTLAGISTLFIWTNFQNNSEENSLALARSIGQSLEERLNQPQFQLEALANVLLHQPEGLNKQALLNSFLSNESRFLRIQIQDSIGTITSTFPENQSILGLDMSAQTFFQVPRQTGKSFWSPIFITPLDNDVVTALSVPFGSQVLTAYISMNWLSHFQNPERLPRLAQLYVTDQNGVYIIHPDQRKVDEREVFPQFETLSHQNAEASFVQTTFLGPQETMYCTGFFIKKYNWAVFLIQPRSYLLQPIFDLLYRLGIAALILSILVIIISLIGFRKVFRPLQDIVLHMQSLSSGQSNVQMSQVNYQEFATIVDQFNLMSAQIQERQQSLTKLNRILDSKNKELENIIYVSSHDLRSPLVNITGFAHEMQEQLLDLTKHWDDPTKRDLLLQKDIPSSLRFIQSSTKRLGQLLHGLLIVTRLNRNEFVAQEVELNSLLTHIVSDLEFIVRQKKGHIQLGKLPSVLGNSSELHTIFQNLIENALKYSNPDIPPVIEITAYIQNNQAYITVADNGIGISSVHLNSIFNIFFRVGTKTLESGDGLGLTIVQRLVERHQGSISVESELNKGSKFLVRLPACSS